jgi:protein-tyrosine phosphatase
MRALLTLALVAVSLSLTEATLSYKRLSIVDFNTTTNQYLFRGNYPHNDNQTAFDYTTLVSYMRKKALESNIVLPKKFKLVDVTFLHSIGNYFDYKLEVDFFKKNPHLGSVLHWTIIGHPINASSLSEYIRKPMVEFTYDWNIEDQLIERTEVLHQFVHTPNNVTTVYYMHCEAGVDRTGQVSGAYYIRHLGWSFLQALAFDYDVSPRRIMALNQNGLNWYCWYNFYKRGYPADCLHSL